MLPAQVTLFARLAKQETVFKMINVPLALLERSFQARTVWPAQILVRPAQMTLFVRLVRMDMVFKITSALLVQRIPISVDRIASVRNNC